ncbi:MAG: SusC/RagA family TonB-linked outer membrane protein [Chitinophagales bacterium]
MKKTLLLWLLGLLLTVQVYAQNRSLSGTVTDATTGEALIGVNVTGKGTTIGTVTDIDGKYTLELPKDVNTLVFSYVGYSNVEKPILALITNVTMSPDSKVVDEVVVTAMSIKREARSTGYATNTVKSEDFNKTATDVFGALQAKTPGISINSISGQAGASSRIVVRGPSSFDGSNNALIIVDGVAVNNNTANGYDNSSAENVDFGNRGMDIDPDNIESITVLKGGAATALYGVRGKYGVILITTKSGKDMSKEDKKFNVTLNTGITFDRAYILLKRQEMFGQGYDNHPDPIENFSWGPAFDGVVRPWTRAVQTPNGMSQLIRPYSPVKNQLQDAFNIGTTFKTGVAVSGGNEKYTYYMAYNNLKNTGIFDNQFYKRHNIVANATAKFNDKISSKFNLQYAHIDQRAVTNAGSVNFNAPYQAFIQQAANIPINELRDYNGIYHGFEGYYGGYTPNPYYIMNNENNDAKIDNIIGSVELEVKPVDYITLTGRAGTNFTLTNLFLESPKFDYPYSSAAGIGRYVEEYDKRNQLTLDFMAAFNKNVIKDLNVNALVGYNFQDARVNTLQSSTQQGLVIPGFYDLSNSVATPYVDNAGLHTRLFGVYGSVGLGYKNMVFVNYTARNDWSSTLPEENNSFFYQSGDVSFIPTELFKPGSKVTDWLNYWKIRASVGTVGGAPDAYSTSSYFLSNPRYEDYSEGNYPVQFPVIGLDGSSVPGYTLDNFLGNPELEPEKSFAWDIGTDITFLKEHVTIEYTYYQKTDKKLIVNVQLPSSSGYTSTSLNIGEMVNKGHELSVSVYALKNIKNTGLNWKLNMSFTKNNNNVVKVSDQSDEVAFSTGGIQVIAKEGMPFGTFKALDFVRDSLGRLVVNEQGAPVASSDYNYFGSYLEKYRIGLGTEISWKGLSFGIQFDIKKGGQYYSGTKSAAEFNGTVLSALVNNREPYVIPNSVVDNGDGTYSTNTTPLTNLFDLVGNLPESQMLIDASFVKLREVTLSYTVQKKHLKNVPINAITVGLVGRNLKFWLPTENIYADPESNSFGQAGNVQGMEFSQTPPTRSFGFDFKIQF